MGTVREVSHSELDALRQCRLKHHLQYRELWQPRETARALSLGTRWHRILEVHYRGLAGIPFPEEWEEDELPREIDHLLYDVGGQQSEEQERCEWMWTGYLERYGEREEEWEILEVESHVRGWLYNRQGNRTNYRMNGRIDMLVRDHSWSRPATVIVDHKSISRRDLSKPLEKDLAFDDQSAIYTRAKQREGVDVRGVIFSHARTDPLKTRELSLDERFRRTLTVRTKEEMETMSVEALELFQSAYGRTPWGVYRPPRSPDPDRCGWRCPFTEPCLLSRKGADLSGLLTSLEYSKGEPRY